LSGSQIKPPALPEVHDCWLRNQSVRIKPSVIRPVICNGVRRNYPMWRNARGELKESRWPR